MPKKEKRDDPLFETAVDISQKTRLVFLDEFQVTDIADAMIMRKIFDVFWKSGMILIVSLQGLIEQKTW